MTPYMLKRQRWLFEQAFKVASKQVKHIDVKYVPVVHYLGTQDGVAYSVYPLMPDDDEADAGHGRQL